MRIGSLFSGIGGLELGLEQAGLGHTVFQVEADPFARKILGLRWPGIPCFNDVREVGAGILPPCDALVGGFPCQDISNAGKREGITGSRSGLWVEFARLIGELQPRLVIVENVAALLKRGADTVLGDLAALGYDARWQTVSASSVGAWHQRDRLFIVAAPASRLGAPLPYASRHGLLGGKLALEEVSGMAERQGMDSGPSSQPLPDASGPGLPVNPGSPAHGVMDRESRTMRNRGEAGASGFWGAEPPLGRVAYGLPSRVDRLKCLGNAVVPEVARRLGLAILERGWADA